MVNLLVVITLSFFMKYKIFEARIIKEQAPPAVFPPLRGAKSGRGQKTALVTSTGGIYHKIITN